MKNYILLILISTTLYGCAEKDKIHEKHGVSKDGERFIEFFENDTLFRKEIYFENGKLYKEQEYYQGEMSGTFREYYKNGNIFKSGTKINGLESGLICIYHENDSGKIKVEANVFNVGNLEIASRQRFYDNNGNLVHVDQAVLIDQLPDSIRLNTSVDYFIIFTERNANETTYLITGEFDDNFRPLSAPDTSIVRSDTIKRQFMQTKSGKYMIRGEFYSEKLVSVSGDTLTTEESHQPFEDSVFVY